MKRSKYSEEQITYAIRQAESGTPVSDVCRQLGISEATFYVWKKKFAHLGVSELRRLRQLEEENARLKGLVADLTFAKHILQETIRKEPVTPAKRRARAQWIQETFHVSVVRACRLAGFSRAAWYRRSRAKDQEGLRLRLRDLATARPRFGYLRLHVLRRREGWMVNKKRVRRLYRLEGLQLRHRVRRRKHMALHRGAAPPPTARAQRWSMDFVHDQLLDGRPFRVLTLIDHWNRESVLLEPAFGSRGARGTPRLDHVRPRHGVHVPRARSVGVRPGRATRLHPTRQAHGQRAHRVLQRPAARRMPERAAVPVACRRPRQAHSLAAGLQRTPPPQRPGTPDPQGVHPEASGHHGAFPRGYSSIALSPNGTNVTHPKSPVPYCLLDGGAYPLISVPAPMSGVSRHRKSRTVGDPTVRDQSSTRRAGNPNAI